MTTTSYTDPAFDDVAARVGAAFQAEAATVDPPDAWSAIVARLDAAGPPSVWSWIRHRPLLVAAAAVLVALIALLTVTLLGGDDNAQDVNMVDTPPTTAAVPVDPEAGPVVGARADGSLVLLDATSGEVASGLVTAEGLKGPKPPEDGGDASLLDELAVSPDGTTVYQARPTALGGTACEGSTFAADWGLWEIDVEERDGNYLPMLPSTEPGVQQPIPPARMPALSPDGTMLAFVTTSNYEACDDSLLVAVADLSGLGTIIATHTLPVGVMPHQLVWSTAERLDIVLPEGDAATSVQVVGVAVDPLVSGPVSIEGEPIWAGTLAAPGRDASYVTVATTYDGVTTLRPHEDPFNGEQPSPVWEVTVNGPELEGAPLALAQDGAGSVWFTLRGPGVGGAGFEPRTYRLPFDGGSPADDPTLVSQDFVAVAASPFA